MTLHKFLIFASFAGVSCDCFGIDTSSCPFTQAEASALTSGVDSTVLARYNAGNAAATDPIASGAGGWAKYVDCDGVSEKIMYDKSPSFKACMDKCETIGGCCGFNYMFYDRQASGNLNTYTRCVAKLNCNCGTSANVWKTSRAGMVFYKRDAAVPPPPPPTPPSAPPESPPSAPVCFPNTAVVTRADGSPVQIDRLVEGDAIVAATADGTITTDTLSAFSLADSTANATFVALTTSSGVTLTLTPAHRLPVGAACCTDLKQAKDLVRGDHVWAAVPSGSTLTKQTVTELATTTGAGLHSPVLSQGTFPIVDGLATSFDSIGVVNFAKYAIPICKATQTCTLIRRGFLAARDKYIDGLVTSSALAAFAVRSAK